MGKVTNGVGEVYVNDKLVGTVTRATVDVKPSHEWDDDLSTCLKCGDKDWMADEFCSESKLKQERQGGGSGEISLDFILAAKPIRVRASPVYVWPTATMTLLSYSIKKVLHGDDSQLLRGLPWLN